MRPNKHRSCNHPQSEGVIVSSAEELLKLATVSYSRVKQVIRDQRETRRHALFIDVIEDMGFFYRQYLLCLQEDRADEEIVPLKEKLARLLDSIEEDLEKLTGKLVEQLESPEEKTVTVVCYILSSVELNKDSSPCLSKVLAAFVNCDAGRLPYFVNGLSHGLHPQLTNGLMLVKEMATGSVKKACETILQNRRHTENGICYY